MQPRFLETGVYHHLGLKTSLLRTSGDWLREILFTDMKPQLNYDSLSLFKSSNQQLWPILGLLVTPLVSEEFTNGNYGGEVKPSDFNEVFAALVTGFRELLTVGIYVDQCQGHLTVKLVAVICDTPARR